MLVGTSRFIDACSILSKEGIPESCHADLIAKFGYDVRWQRQMRVWQLSQKEENSISLPPAKMCSVSRKIEKPKRFNWFYKELGYVRPGSIEMPGCFQVKNQNRTIRSSMGDCHSFDPGSKFGLKKKPNERPRPGAYDFPLFQIQGLKN